MQTTIDFVKLREARGNRTAASVAEVLEISRQHLWHIETGRRKPGSEILVRLCWLYGIELSDVATGFTNGNKSNTAA